MSCNLNKIDGFISGFDVVASDATGGKVQFVLQDPNHLMRNSQVAKAILMKAATDWLAGLSSAETLYSTDDDCDNCKGSNANVEFYYGSKTLVITTAETAPVSPVTATVPMPLDCDTTVTFA